MYHIKNDKRCRKSAELIGNAVMQLLETKALDEITVTDIQKKSGVGRSTFYRIFDTVADVLVMKSDEECAGMAKAYLDAANHNGQPENVQIDLIRLFFDYWHEHDKIIGVLFKANRLDIFDASMFAAYDGIADVAFPAIDRKSEDYHYFIAMKLSIATGFLAKWITEGKTKTTDEIMQILRRSFIAATKYLFSDLINSV